MQDIAIAKAYDVQVRTVERLRQRFVEEGYEIALQGKKGQVEKGKVFDSRVETKLIALRCSDVPAGSNKWTLRLLSDKMVELEYVESISHESVRQLLKKHQLNLGK
jgi:transposase